MRLFKPEYSVPGKCTRYICSKWYVRFNFQGRTFRRSLHTTDKRLARRLASALRRREVRRSAGLLDPAEEHAERAIAEHLNDFESMLRSRGVSEAHRSGRMRVLGEFVRHGNVRRIRDLDEPRATSWLCSAKEKGLAARTTNCRLKALRQFVRWAIANRRLLWDPIVSLRLLNEQVDRRHVRRALAPDEFARLLAAAERRPLAEKVKERVIKGVTPEERAKLLALGRIRALAYSVAAVTGLRRGELSRMRWGDLNLEKRIVFVPASSAKSRRDQSVPLRSDLAVSLTEYRPTGVAAGDLVFPHPVFPTLRTFKRDAVEAGLGTSMREDGKPRGCETYDLTDDSGRSLDFHCLRVTFVSNLVAAGVHPRVAQALARHAKIETTMGAYTDLTSLDLRGAIERHVPAIGPSMDAGSAGGGSWWSPNS